MIDQSILDRILNRYQKAIQYSTIDPEVALSEARKTAEAILKLLYTQQKEQDPQNQLFNKPVEKKMLSDLASIMEKIKRYPLIVATAVRTIQAFGNIGAHDQGEEADHVDEESIMACTTALTTLMKWFWQDCEQDLEHLGLQSTSNTATVPNVGGITPTSTPEKNIEQTQKSTNKLLFGAIAILFIGVGIWLGTQQDATDKLDSTKVVDKEDPTMVVTKFYEQNQISVPPAECLKENSEILGTLSKTPIEQIYSSSLQGHITESILLRSLIAKQWNNNRTKNDTNTGLETQIKDHLQSLVTDCTNWSFPHLMLGNYWYNKEDYTAAQSEFALALSLDAENAEARFNSALSLLKTKDFPNALEQINALEKTHPNHRNLYLVKTQILIANNQIDLAEVSGVKAYNIPESSAKAALLLWQIYSKLGQQEKANQYACSALEKGMEQAKPLCK